jgi:DNA-binding transcriptional LysR family regulator
VVAAPGLRQRVPRRITREALRGARWAMREPDSGSRELVDRWLLEHLGRIDVAFELGSLEAIRRLVAAGAALGCLSRLAVAGALADGSLVALRTGLPPARRRLAIVMHRDKRIGQGAQDFLLHCEAAG